uniref:Uncharacterized protein n=1 Tax=Oncorhynchus kisutch TaxID=8019 RepID=A0A8C7M6I7_ONCKI
MPTPSAKRVLKRCNTGKCSFELRFCLDVFLYLHNLRIWKLYSLNNVLLVFQRRMILLWCGKCSLTRRTIQGKVEKKRIIILWMMTELERTFALRQQNVDKLEDLLLEAESAQYGRNRCHA